MILCSLMKKQIKVTGEKIKRSRILVVTCSRGKASMILKHNPLLNCVVDIYTLNIFKLFELEFINSLNTTFIQQPSNFSDSLFEFKIIIFYGENTRVKQMVFNKETREVQCSCHILESMGILGQHTLIVFNVMNMDIIPNS